MTAPRALLFALLTLSAAPVATADFDQTCTDVAGAGLIVACDYTATYAPVRCGAPASGQVEGHYLLVGGLFIVDAGQGQESGANGYAVDGAYAATALTYTEVFAYEANCGHGNGAAVVVFVGPAGAIVHVNDEEGAIAQPFLP